ncbi:MAG TPA: DUF4349 domain-containing protein [Gaiellaceae bacterium]|nr:DUF4349 domain-containing protein [Gaiellaceae bacterium]
MSRLDVYAELRDTRPAAPAELRERVRTIAATEAAPPTPGRRRPVLSPRLALGTLLAAAAAVAIAVGVSQRGSEPQISAGRTAPLEAQSSGAADSGRALKAPAPSRTRLQDYDATLGLRVRDPAALSAATRRALAIVRSLGGFATVVDLHVDGGEGDATIRVRVPVGKVGRAVERLTALGTITESSVQVQDRQAGVNAGDREIARLQRQLRALRAREQTDATKRQIAALTARVQGLQRNRAETVRQARLATISLQLTTRGPAPAPHHDGPLHGVVVALRYLGIGAVYALAIGGPILLLALAARLAWLYARRRGERRLLERP